MWRWFSNLLQNEEQRFSNASGGAPRILSEPVVFRQVNRPDAHTLA